MTTETITEKIHKEADKALKAEIDAAAYKLHSLITNGQFSLYSYELRELQTETKVNGFGMLEQMKHIAFEGQKENRRQIAINEFMAKVEAISSDIEELRNSIPQ